MIFEKDKKRIFFVAAKITIISVILCMFFITDLKAQEYPPGFDVRMEWEHFEEQSKDRREIGVTDIGARVGYSFPHILDLYVALSWQDMECKLPDSEGLKSTKLDLDPALAFKVGTKIYAIRNIPVGVPADFILSFSYNTARHKDNAADDKLRHRRIIGTCGLEWRYTPATPFINLGVLSSKLEGEDDRNYDQTSLFFIAGSSFQLMDNLFFRIELNWCQEVGYAIGFQYML